MYKEKFGKTKKAHWNKKIRKQIKNTLIVLGVLIVQLLLILNVRKMTFIHYYLIYYICSFPFAMDIFCFKKEEIF